MNIDTSCFKAFQAAVKTLNFTEAARVAGMTQSGVSQHIAKLEKDLGVNLFLRVAKRIHLTDEGRVLNSYIDAHQDLMTSLVESLQDSTLSLRGQVRYSMPDSCLLSPHFGLLLKDKVDNFPAISLKVNLNHSEGVVEEVLSHGIDFGFVTKQIPNDALLYEDFCDEEYVLITPRKMNWELADATDSRWIAYPGFVDIFGKWSAGQTKKNSKFSLSYSGETNGLKAALMMVSHGLGMTVLPRHCVESFEDKRNIKIQDEDSTALKNGIFIITLTENPHSKRVQKVIESFRTMKSEFPR